MIIKVEKSKTDQLRLGDEVVIAQSGGSICPVSRKKISADLQDLRYKINYTTYNTTENDLLTQHYVP